MSTDLRVVLDYTNKCGRLFDLLEDTGELSSMILVCDILGQSDEEISCEPSNVHIEMSSILLNATY